MATTLDAVLRIVAKADATALGAVQRGITGIKNAADSANRSMSGLTGVFGALTGGVAALGVGLSAAGLAAFAKQAVDAADNLRDMSLTTGVSVESLSKFQQAANMSGTSIEDVGKSMVKLQRNMVAAAATGQGPAAEAFRKLGISVTDTTGKLRPVEDVMLDIFEALSQVPDRSIRTSLAMDALGKSGARLVPMMEEGRAGVEGLNAAFSTEFANRADAYNDSIAAMGASFSQFGAIMTNDILPYATDTIDFLTKLGVVVRDYFVNNKEAIGAALNVLSVGLKALTGVTAPWVETLGKGLGLVVSSSKTAGQEVDKLKSRFNGAKIEAEALEPPVKKVKEHVEKIPPKIDEAKQRQEAFNVAVQQSNAQYSLLTAVIDSTSQAIQGQARLRDATLTADIAINNAAKSILEAKLGQTQTDAEKIPILQQIQAIDLENARLQKESASAQIQSEVEIAGLKKEKAAAELEATRQAFETAKAYGQQTAELQTQLNLKRLAAGEAARDYTLSQRIAEQRERANQAAYEAQRTQIMNQQMPGMVPVLQPAVTGSYNVGPAIPSGWPTLPGYASGGYVTGPQLAWIGEGGQSEYVIPASRMAAASASYLAGARGAAVLTGGGGAGGPIIVNIKTGPTMQFGGQDWVTRADMTRAVSEAVRETRRALLSPGGRAEMGMA